MVGAKVTNEEPRRDGETDRKIDRMARVAVAPLTPERRTELANMLMDAGDWRRLKEEFER